MSNKNIIKKITIELSGKTIELSIDEAEELREALNTLMGGKSREYIPYPVPQPIYPVYPIRYRDWGWVPDRWYTTCGGSLSYSISNETANICLASSKR